MQQISYIYEDHKYLYYSYFLFFRTIIILCYNMKLLEAIRGNAWIQEIDR